MSADVDNGSFDQLACEHGLPNLDPDGLPKEWIIGGVLVSFGAAGIQQSGIALHQHFNHNDIYHVVQMAGVYLLYRGARLLRDR